MKEIKINKKADGYSNRMIVVEMEDICFLISYNTLIAYKDKAGKLHKTWSGYSRTSLRHLARFGYPASKNEWQALPCEPIPSDYAFSFAFGTIGNLLSRKVAGGER